jgi:hypothetical protein
VEHDVVAAGLDLIEPGLVPVSEWRPVPGEARLDPPVPVYAVLGRKRGRAVVPLARRDLGR